MKVLIIVGGSGTRKASLKDLIVKYVKGAEHIPSMTSRPPRPGEVHGVDYLFYLRSTIEWVQQGKQLIEVEEIQGNLYATWEKYYPPKLSIYVVEHKGAAKLKKHFGKDAYCVCIKNDNYQVRQRMRAKGREASADIVALEAANSLLVADEEISDNLDHFAKRLGRELNE